MKLLDDWKRRVISTLVRVEPDADFNLFCSKRPVLGQEEPDWRLAVAEKVLTSSAKGLGIEERSVVHFSDPRKLGALVGVKKAAGELMRDGMRRNRELAIQGRLPYLNRFLWAYFGLPQDSFVPFCDQYLGELRIEDERAVRRCLAIASGAAGAELSEFLRGFSDACGTFVAGPRGECHGETSASPIYRTLFCFGSLFQEKLHSIAELHVYLRSVHGSQVVGPEDRIKKLCKRIGYRITRRGRPKGKRDIHEISRSLFPRAKAVKDRLDENIIASQTVHAKAGLLQTRSRRSDRSKPGHD